MTAKIVVAAHIAYPVPQDDIYYPIHAGKSGRESIEFPGDDTGENISHKNDFYSELTCLYWAWKNLRADYLGLVHYRRHFRYRKKGSKWDSVLSHGELEKVLQETEVVLPRKRRYYIETVGSHYGHTFDELHLSVARAAIEDMYPQYTHSFDKIMDRRSAHMFNMFIMKREYADAYCQWLFSVLEELETRIDVSGMTPFEARYLGRVSERLLDVWIDKNKIRYKEIGYIQMEPVNWAKKGSAFLLARFGGKKYKNSF